MERGGGSCVGSTGTTQQTTPSAEAQAAESYLQAFHDNAPGRQSEGVETHRAADGRSSYEVLADRVGPVRRVLDLGCADGALLALFARRGAEELAGVDLSSGRRVRLLRAGPSPGPRGPWPGPRGGRGSARSGRGR